jgi:CrcB protein
VDDVMATALRNLFFGTEVPAMAKSSPDSSPFDARRLAFFKNVPKECCLRCRHPGRVQRSAKSRDSDRETPVAGPRREADVIPIDPDLVDDVPPPRRTSRPYAPYRVDPRLLVAVAAGGALGAPARFAISRLLPTAAGSFPWATLWTNLSGAFVLGFVLVFLLERFRPSRYLRAFIGTGFCGAYTTVSTLAVETDLLIRDDHYLTATTYVTVSVLAGLAVVYFGMALARLLPAHPARRARP